MINELEVYYVATFDINKVVCKIENKYIISDTR